MIIGLIVQYCLGMAINVFVQFPQNQGSGMNWQFATRNILIMAHLILGTLLIVGAIAQLVRVVRAKSAAWKLPAAYALVGVIVAWIGGDTFVTTQIAVLSYIMSLGFLVAILSYFWGLYRSRAAETHGKPGRV